MSIVGLSATATRKMTCKRVNMCVLKVWHERPAAGVLVRTPGDPADPGGLWSHAHLGKQGRPRPPRHTAAQSPGPWLKKLDFQVKTDKTEFREFMAEFSVSVYIFFTLLNDDIG